MESGEKDKGFTVQDRRRFSAEGETKSDQPQEEPAPSAAAEAQPSAATRAERAHPSPEPEINFATFVVGLSTQALAALGEMPDPATGENLRDLHAAQQLIDIIGMLREKTRGNLDHEEDGLMEAILFDLRMKYVELARQSGR